jgi:hypothetical protein
MKVPIESSSTSSTVGREATERTRSPNPTEEHVTTDLMREAIRE